MRQPEGERKENARGGNKRGRGGHLEAMNCGSLCLSFVSARVCVREGGHRAMRMGMCGDIWKDMRATLL